MEKSLSTKEESIVRLSLKDNVIDYLKKTAFFSGGEDSMKWKWMTISAHGALYHLMIICLLEGGISGVWKKERVDSRGFSDVFKQFKEDLKSFLTLYEQIKGSISHMTIKMLK